MDFKKIKQDGRRVLIVGDIHGCLDELHACLKQLNWNRENDLLISVGDLIDRGPKNHETLLFAKENIECVLGNHDSFMVDQITGYGTTNTWMANGGIWALGDEQKYYKITNIVGSWMLTLPIALEVELDSGGSIGVVHAELPAANNDWDLFTRMLSNNRIVQSAIWGRSRIRDSSIDNNIKRLKNLFVGHTVVPEPVLTGNIWYLDTGCVFYKNLSFAIIQPTGEQEIVTFHLQNVQPENGRSIPFSVSK